MPVIRITGLPLEVNVQKQLKILRIYLRKCDIEKFWVNEISDTRGTEFKEAAIEVLTEDDAYRVESFLSKVPYRKDGMPHFLRAEVLNYDCDHKRSRSRSPRSDHRSNTRNRSRDRHYERYSPMDSRDRYRSRSPLYEEEPSQLDIEIELLRKKRQLIEEERRLLAEKTKLEIMQEFGANSSRELEYFEESRDRDRRPRKSDRIRGVSPPPAPRVTLPLFVMPCKHIMKQMRSVIRAATKSVQERLLIMKLIRTHLRRSLALALADRDFLPTNAIIELYRELQPLEKDKEFVNKLLQDIRYSFWPMKPERQKPTRAPQEKKQANKSNPDVSAKVVKKGTEEKPVSIKKEVDVKPNVEGIKPSTNLVSKVEPTNVAEQIVVKVEPSNASDQTESTNRAQVDSSKHVEQVDSSKPVDKVDSSKPVDKVDSSKPVNQVDSSKLVDQVDSSKLVDQVDSFKLVNQVDSTESEIIESTVSDQVVATNLEQILPTNTVGQSINDGGEGRCTSADAVVVNPIASNNAEEEYDVDEDDWVTNGIDWEDDDDESKDEQ